MRRPSVLPNPMVGETISFIDANKVVPAADFLYNPMVILPSSPKTGVPSPGRVDSDPCYNPSVITRLQRGTVPFV